MSENEVAVVEFEHRAGWRGTLWYAVVAVEGSTLHFSRYDDESAWYCDAHFGPTGFPQFCHGEGSRCCLKKVAAGELQVLLDAKQKRVGRPTGRRSLSRKEGGLMETKVICPIVHMNGTGREELLRQRADLHLALLEVETKLRQAYPNARDYYVEPGLREKAMAQHERRLGVLRGLREEVEAELREIDDASDAAQNGGHNSDTWRMLRFTVSIPIWYIRSSKVSVTLA